MNKQAIYNTIKSLARSQGFYCRVLENLTEEQLKYLERQKFKTPVDLVLFLETGF